MDWKDACKKLQKEGLKFEFYCAGSWAFNTWNFTEKIEDYRIATQPIPDREDWRESCRKLHGCGVAFDFLFQSEDWMVVHITDFGFDRTSYRIPYQPIPAGIEKYLEEEMHEEETTAKLSSLKVNHNQNKPEIPHLEQQIQWHEDKLHSLRTGEPMREWEYRLVVGDGEWKICNDPHFSEKYEYRRKLRTITYWHCVGVYYGYEDNRVVDREVFSSDYGADEVQSQIDRCKENYPTAKFSPIIETTVELED